jgi:hypothetical protein
MKKLFSPVLGTLFVCATVLAQQETWTASRPGGHAPIHVMGDHMHAKGELMFSYRFMTMQMQGLLSASSEIQDSEVFKTYMAAPKDMTMNMHMLGAMYAPSDKLTLMVMANYNDSNMQLRSKMNMPFETQSSGFGDVSISGLIHLMTAKRQKMHAQVGVSLPIGSLNQRGSTPMNSDVRLAYPMQLGSGTWDPYVALTYLGQTDNTSWGLQSGIKTRLGENAEGYTLGNNFHVVGWCAAQASKSLSFSGSMRFTSFGSISGQDVAFNPMMMPMFDTKNSGRTQLNPGLGSNYLISEGAFKNLRFAVEIIWAVSQKVEGIQMKNTWCGMFGLQYALGHH